MKKLVTMLVFLAITGVTTACGASPVGVGEIDPGGRSDPSGSYSPPDSEPDPNGLYSPPDSEPDPNG